MRSHDLMQSDEANDAAWEAGKGAVVGAAKWGAATAVLGGIGLYWSPVYRATTIQFKVYIQMSGMVLGGMIHADRSLRQYESQIRMQRRRLRDQARWAQYEEEIARQNGKDR